METPRSKTDDLTSKINSTAIFLLLVSAFLAFEIYQSSDTQWTALSSNVMISPGVTVSKTFTPDTDYEYDIWISIEESSLPGEGTVCIFDPPEKPFPFELTWSVHENSRVLGEGNASAPLSEGSRRGGHGSISFTIGRFHPAQDLEHKIDVKIVAVSPGTDLKTIGLNVSVNSHAVTGILESNALLKVVTSASSIVGLLLLIAAFWRRK
ncbi:hypothetical protein JYT83_01205 [bacterium AH-315-F18]|nr:hypothetical protein [bacterium AH-315-F18]